MNIRYMILDTKEFHHAIVPRAGEPLARGDQDEDRGNLQFKGLSLNTTVRELRRLHTRLGEKLAQYDRDFAARPQPAEAATDAAGETITETTPAESN